MTVPATVKSEVIDVVASMCAMDIRPSSVVQVKDILEEFGAYWQDNIYVTDNGANVKAAFKDQQWISCAGHNLNLVLVHGLKDDGSASGSAAAEVESVKYKELQKWTLVLRVDLKELEKQSKETQNLQDNVKVTAKVSMDRLTFSMQDTLDDESSDNLSEPSVGASSAVLDNRYLMRSSPLHSSVLKSSTFTVHSRSPSNVLTYDDSINNFSEEQHLKKLLEECSEQVKDLQRKLNESNELQEQQKFQFKQSMLNLQTQTQELERERDSLVNSRKEESQQEVKLRKELQDTIGDLKATNMLHEEIVKQSNVQNEQLKEMLDDYNSVLQEIRTALIGFESSKGKKVCEREPISKLQVNSLGSAVTKVLSELDTELSFLKGKLFLVEGQCESLRMESHHKLDFVIKQHEDRYDELLIKYEQEVGMLTDKRNIAQNYAMSIQNDMESMQEQASIQNSLYIRQLTELESTVTQLRSELREVKRMRTEKIREVEDLDKILIVAQSDQSEAEYNCEEKYVKSINMNNQVQQLKADLQKYDELLRMEKEQNKKLCERDSGNSLTIAQLQQDLDNRNMDMCRLEAQIKAMKDEFKKHTEQQGADVEKKEALEKAAYFNSQLDSTKKMLSKITNELAVTKRNLEKAEKTIADLTSCMGEKRTSEADKEKAAIVAKNAYLTTQLDSTKDMLSKTTDELTAMKRDLENANKTIADLTSRVEETGTNEADGEMVAVLEKNEALEKVAYLTCQLDSTKQMLSKTTDELTIRKKDLKTAEKTIADLMTSVEEKRICKANREKASILEKNEALEKVTCLSTQLHSTKDKLSKTNDELSARKVDLDNAKKTIADLTRLVEEKETSAAHREKASILEKNEALEKVTCLSTQLHSTKDKLSKTNDELSARKMDLDNAKKTIADLTRLVEEKETSAAHREQASIGSNNETLEKVACLTTELQSTKDMLSKTSHELTVKTRDLEKAEETVADLTSCMEEIRTNGEDREKSVTLEKNESLQKVACLTTKLHSTKDELSKTNDELTCRKKKLEKAEKTIADLTSLMEEMRTSAADRENAAILEKNEALQKVAYLTTQLKSTKDMLSQTNDDLTARKRDLEIAKKTIVDFKSCMKDKRTSEASCVDSTDDDMELLKKDIEQLREACAEADILKLQLDEKDKKLCSLQKQVDDMTEMIERCNKSSSAMQLENTKLMKEIDYRKRELAELKMSAVREKDEILEKVKFLTSKLNLTEEMLRRTANELSAKQSVLETTEKTLQEKKKTIESSSSELSILHSQMNQKSQDFQQLEKEVKQLQKASLEADTLNQQLAEKNKEIFNIQSQVENMTQMMAQQSQRASAMELDKSNLLNDISLKEKEMQELKMASIHSKTEAQEKVALLTSQLELTQEMLHKTTDELSSKKKDMEKAQRAIADLTSSLHEKKKIIEAASVEIKKLYAQIDCKTQDIQQLKKDTEELQKVSAEVESLKMQLTEKDKKIYIFKNQVDNLTQKVEQYTQKADDVNTEKSNLLRVISSRNEEMKDLKMAKENKEARIHELQAKISDLETEKKKLVNSNAEELRTTKQLTLEREQLKSQMKTLNNELSNLAEEHETLKNNYQYKNEEMERITTKLKLQLKTTSAELEQTKGALKSCDEVDEQGLKAAMEMQKQITIKLEQIDTLQSKIRYLEEMLENETKVKLHLHEENRKQSDELSSVKAEKNKLAEELEKFKSQELHLKEKISDLDSTLEKVSKKFAEYHATIQRMEQESVLVKLQHTLDVKDMQGPGHISASTSVQPPSASKSHSRIQTVNLPPTLSSSKSRVPAVVKTKGKKEDLLLNLKPLLQQLKITPAHLTKRSDDGYRKEEASSCPYRQTKDATKQCTADNTTGRKPSTLHTTDLEEQISRLMLTQKVNSQIASTASGHTSSPDKPHEDWKTKSKSPVPKLTITTDDSSAVPSMAEKPSSSKRCCSQDLSVNKSEAAGKTSRKMQTKLECLQNLVEDLQTKSQGMPSMIGKQDKSSKKVKDQEQMLME
ncbi:coiled-coil domain-containing protein 158 [Microcaecilia unicolor]|uniref:Coiled-coil domain-containing protein 158 n=1 Tax=Microcaecilia unicolor TaxID=1415580 RepID=A0A6P7XBP3_9AMPH|nr:coiled-coil domain-containing protein 158 [Microcaecilia unicolor]